MRGVKAVCLAMGILSLVLLAVAGAMAWFAGSLPAQPFAREQTHFAARVQAAPSCEALKAVCTDVAAGYDSQHATVTRLNRLTDELLKRIAWFVAGWAAATAAAFFYLLRAATGREGPGASEASHSVGGRR